MENTNTYNGWTNYATWAVKLWLDNDQLIQDDMYALVREYNDKEIWTLAEALENEVTDMITEDVPVSLALDLLNNSLANVNWREIAEAYREEVASA